MSAPTKEFLRYGDVVAWFCGEGICRTELEKLIAAGVIRGAPLRDGGRNYYFKSQIERDVISRSHNAVASNGHTNGKLPA